MAIEDTRDKILSVANNLFIRFGFHKTSMDEIAKLRGKQKARYIITLQTKKNYLKKLYRKK